MKNHESLHVMNPFFSVIIPCYNSWQYMTRGLFSLEQQTFKDFEVIIVDDCSTDGTYSQLLNYQQNSDLSVVVLRNAQNAGPGVSRNYAISQAQGLYIAFMDSDDWYENALLQEVYNKIIEESAEMVFYDFYRAYNANKKQYIQATRPLKNAHSKTDFVALSFDSLWSLCIKRDVFRYVKISPLFNAEDVVTIPLLVNRVSRVAVLHKPLYNYLYRIDSLSTSKNRAIAESVLKAFSFLEENLSNESVREAKEYRGVLLVLYGYVYKALQGGMASEEISHVVDCFIDKYPNFQSNKYLKFIPLRKRLFIQFAKFHLWLLLKIYIKIQDWLISYPAKIRSYRERDNG